MSESRFENMIREQRFRPVPYQPPVVGGYCFLVAGTEREKSTCGS